ncbi:MAG: DUF4142 domain-containing protein [Pseudomonadota bacterium]|nr:DUF4142 domain-containing protein [Pseudomonadota bacterium]
MAANAQDLQFIAQAAQSGTTDIADGLLAAQLSGSPAVNQLGVQEVTDHVSLNNLLLFITQTDGLPTPPALTPLYQSQANSAKYQFGPNSDQQYLMKEVLGHQQDLNLYQTEAANGQDPLLRSFAQGSIPVLQQHLSTATNLLNFGDTYGYV